MVNQQTSPSYLLQDSPYRSYDIILLHGLFGNLSNWQEVVNEFSIIHNVLVPTLPLFEINITGSKLDGLVEFLKKNTLIKKVFIKRCLLAIH